MKADKPLQGAASVKLKREPSLQATQRGAEVNAGAVALAGEVGCVAEERRVDRATQSVPGVQALAVARTVEPNWPDKRLDADIAREAENALGWSLSLPVGIVNVMVLDGWVTLTGTVDWQLQRHEAADAILELWGVTGLSNQISIHPAASLAEKKEPQAAGGLPQGRAPSIQLPPAQTLA